MCRHGAEIVHTIIHVCTWCTFLLSSVENLTLVCTESAKSAVGALGAHFVMSMGYTDTDFMQTFSLRMNILCRLFAYLLQTMHKLHAHFVQTM